MIDMTARALANKNKNDISNIVLGGVPANSITDDKLSATGIKATVGTIGGLITTNKTSLVSAINENVSVLNLKLDTSRHYLTYKNLSMHVGLGGTSVPSTTSFAHFAYQGVDATFIIPVNVLNATDPNPTIMNDSVILSALANAQSVGVKTTQIKLHLGMNFSDSLNRATYIPTASIFFPNWKIICMHYAQFCVSNNISVLAIGCEQQQQSVNANYSYWADIVHTIRASYPTLKITYCANGYEQLVTDVRQIWDLFDFLGFNMYFKYTNKLYSQNPTMSECINSFYNYPVPTSTMEQINFHAKLFNKQIYVTETGLQALDSGLAMSYDSLMPRALINYNYDVTAFAMQAICDGLFQNPNIIGFSWWSFATPFDYTLDTSVTSAEQMMSNYVKGGLI